MKEEQIEEVEILESIYPEELTRVGDSAVAVHLLLEGDADQGVVVEVEFPDAYPEAAVPLVRVSPDDSDPTAKKGDKYSYKLTAQDCTTLAGQAAEVAEENLGLPSVFTIVSAIKENAELLYESAVKQMELERLRLLELEEEKEQQKFRGTPVTKESFAAWRQRFRAEMGLDKPKERISGRYTGREIFLKGLYKEDDEDDEEEP